MLQASSINQNSKEYEYLFTADAWENYKVNENFKKESEHACIDR